MGYDIGNVLAHLYFPLVLNLTAESADEKFTEWLLTSIKETYDKVLEKLSNVYDETVSVGLYQNKLFKQKYLADVMADTVGYTGTEIIRRVVGDSKVKELALIPEEKKIEAERILITSGIQLVKEREAMTNGQSLIDAFIKCKEGI